jgi:hypothetical protein
LRFPTGDRLGISRSREERGRSDASVRLWEQVCLHGGQVVSWRNDRGEELLFTSSKVSLFQMPMLVAGSYLLLWDPLQCGFDPVTVTNCRDTRQITVLMNIQFVCLQKHFCIVYNLMTLENRIYFYF